MVLTSVPSGLECVSPAPQRFPTTTARFGDGRLGAAGEHLGPVPPSGGCPRHVRRHKRLEALSQQVKGIAHPSPVADLCHAAEFLIQSVSRDEACWP